MFGMFSTSLSTQLQSLRPFAMLSDRLRMYLNLVNQIKKYFLVNQ